jgi:hypothetical protein
MRLASSVSVNTQMGGYSIGLGHIVMVQTGTDQFGSPQRVPGPKIDRIEVNMEEYPDHSETSIRFKSEGKIVQEFWDCPVDIIYLPEAEG